MKTRIATLLLVLLWCSVAFLPAQDAARKTPPKPRKSVGLKAKSKKPARKSTKKDDDLQNDQRGISSRYKKFEKKLLQLAEFLRESDPERAELLRRAYGRSRDDNISSNMERIAALLAGQRKLGDAVDGQSEVVTHLQSLLILLQSDDLKDSLKKEQDRIKDLLKNLRSVIGKQKRTRTGNERGEAAERVARQQQDVEKQARDLIKKIDGPDAEKKDGKSKDGK
ncbi:MAG: hypothetical protein QF363_19000, partial [Planctomycetaceae bacterium]|nr:hypothetical protein [Planctomycetaceae bacterium]